MQISFQKTSEMQILFKKRQKCKFRFKKRRKCKFSLQNARNAMFVSRNVGNANFVSKKVGNANFDQKTSEMQILFKKRQKCKFCLKNVRNANFVLKKVGNANFVSKKSEMQISFQKNVGNANLVSNIFSYYNGTSKDEHRLYSNWNESFQHNNVTTHRQSYTSHNTTSGATNLLQTIKARRKEYAPPHFISDTAFQPHSGFIRFTIFPPAQTTITSLHNIKTGCFYDARVARLRNAGTEFYTFIRLHFKFTSVLPFVTAHSSSRHGNFEDLISDINFTSFKYRT
jgi:hypothetical protein